MQDESTIGLTNSDYWESVYRQRHRSGQVDTRGFRHRQNRIIASLIEKLGLDNKVVLEVGAGDSAWLCYFAKKYPRSRFVGIDFSEEGCDKLRQRILAENIVNIEVFNKDLFEKDEWLESSFDIVISFGVVEHFRDLPLVLSAKKKYLKKGGFMFTLIPNMTGAIGFFTKMWRPDIYKLHIPHDWNSFFDGHQRAGLEVTEGGYLLSTGFGVLSSCVIPGKEVHPKRSHILTYVWLSRLSNALYLFEDTFFSFPASRLFSPYIYAISRLR